MREKDYRGERTSLLKVVQDDGIAVYDPAKLAALLRKLN